ncbi:MAG TPA: hypothetical protein VGA62_07680 [Acidimicrobiia bacterium]
MVPPERHPELTPGFVHDLYVPRGDADAIAWIVTVNRRWNINRDDPR